MAKVGDTVTPGTLIAVIAEGASAATPAEPKKQEAASPPPPPPPPVQEQKKPAPTPPPSPPPAAAKSAPPRPAGSGLQEPQLPPKGGERRVRLFQFEDLSVHWRHAFQKGVI